MNQIGEGRGGIVRRVRTIVGSSRDSNEFTKRGPATVPLTISRSTVGPRLKRRTAAIGSANLNQGHNWPIRGVISPLTDGAAVMRISMRWATWSGGPVTSFCLSLLYPLFFYPLYSSLAHTRPYVSLRYSAIYNSRMAREDRFGSSTENRGLGCTSWLMELSLSGSWMGCVHYATSAARSILRAGGSFGESKKVLKVIFKVRGYF